MEKRIDLVLEEHGVLQYVRGKVPQLNKDDREGKANFRKGEVKAQRILFESLKDHLIPFVSELDTLKEVYDTLVNLYSINNVGQNISSRNQLCDTKMSKDEPVASYLMKIAHIRDQLQSIGEVVYEFELITTTINWPLELWDAFAIGICARKDTQVLKNYGPLVLRSNLGL